MRDIVILTHKNCIDGFAAAWVIFYNYHLLENLDITYILNFIYIDELNIDAGIEEFKEYCEKIGCYKAYAFDIDFDYESYQKIMKIFPEIVIMSHHHDGKEDILKHLVEMPKNYIYKNTECGCSLAWKMFFKDLQMPAILEYIRDAELGQFRLENSKIIWEGICGILTIGDFDKWTEFIINDDRSLEELEKIGKVLCEIRDEENIKLIETGKILEFGDEKKKGFVINTTGDKLLVLKLAQYINGLRDENNKYLADFSLIWNYDMSKSLYNVVLIPNQNKDQIDIQKIARLFSDDVKKIKNIKNIKNNSEMIILDCEELSFL